MFKKVNNCKHKLIIESLITLISLDGNFPSRLNLNDENLIMYVINYQNSK
jgi:hypothetical protein